MVSMRRVSGRCGVSGRLLGLVGGAEAAVMSAGCEPPRPAVTEVNVAETRHAAEAQPQVVAEEPEEAPVAPRVKRQKATTSTPVVEAETGPAPAQSAVDRAKEEFKLGTAAYLNADYANAKLHFEAAYAIVPENALLFNIASTELKLGQTSASCSHFRQYVARGDPSDPRIQQVSQQVAQRCP